MYVIVFGGPKHIQVRLQWIFNHDLRIITVAGITVIIAVDIGERNEEIIDLIQLTRYPLSVTEGYGHRLGSLR